ncbi:putative baseplate assembly protein [Paenibacillus rigui]|uniref:Putative baseplate assembly protein n=2 Tax=Paenibacillus rigui TaxID=554312 RepID=A0A229UQ79_9BACL|nr:putative baseplate assembly protein [Paenibacillus rigui]
MYRKGAGPLIHPPKIDSREVSDLIDRMKEMVPYYTPEWRFTPDSPDPGTALFLLFSEMFHENIKRLNRVPAKNLIAFLNLFDITLLPARPASTHLTFRLNEGTPDPVFIPAGTRVTAEEEAGPVPYETGSALLLTPATWKAGFVTSKKRDAIVQLSEAFLQASRQGELLPTPLFRYTEEENVQEHALLIGHNALFTVFETARIEVELGNSAKRYEDARLVGQLANPLLTEWLYASSEGWSAFDRVEVLGSRIVLYKEHLGEMVEREVNGTAGRWIQCRLKPHAEVPVHPSNDERVPLCERGLVLDHMHIKTDYIDSLGRGGLQPDLMFYNDVQADPEGFYPFGDHFALYGMFYISSQEAFSKRDGWIELEFHLSAIRNRFQPESEQQVDWKLIMKKSQFRKADVPLVSISRVIWEYWNGAAWVRLNAGPGAEAVFYEVLEGSEGKRRLAFRCPHDAEPTFVNGIHNYWIRARIVQIENAYAPNAMYLSPWMADVRMTYGYEERTYPVEACLTVNNTITVNETQRIQEGRAIEPFAPLECKHPALYLGFDQPPLRGPISVYVSVPPHKEATGAPPYLEWEYMRSSAFQGGTPEWAPLKLSDGTGGLLQSGLLQFAGPADFAKARQLGVEGYWIRAVNRDDRYDNDSDPVGAPMVNGLFINTVQVQQQESLHDEIPELRRDRTPYYQLSRTHIVSEEVWVNETEHLAEEEVARFEEQGFPPAQIVRDSEGQVQRAWIRWTCVESLADSRAKDRHYTLDRTFGQLRFGDGIHGMAPPKEGSEQLKVSYKVTLGDQGNVGAGRIANLQNSIAFVGSVCNIEAAAGGCSHESIEAAVQRGPQRLKHNNRGVTAEDFEWLAREAYPNIAKVKCLANRNVRMEREIGCMTLIVLPKDGETGMAAFPVLKKQVEKYILERASGLVAFPEFIRVIEPVFLEISVTAAIAVQDMEAVLPTELLAMEKLNRFLNPLTGNFDGKGWDIGQHIHPSVFYALLKSIHAIQFVEKLYMTVYKLERGQRSELDGNSLSALPHGVVISGKHKISVRTV